MRAFLDAAYALMVDEATHSGVARGDVVEALEKQLGEPLPDEVAAEELAMRRAVRMAEENAPALARLAGIAALEQGRQPRG